MPESLAPEIIEEELDLSQDEEKERLDSLVDSNSDDLLDRKEAIQEEAYAAAAAQALEASLGRSLGEQTLREEYSVWVNANGEAVTDPYNETKGKVAERITKNGEKVSFTAELTTKDADRFIGVTHFIKELRANGFTTWVDENNPDRGSLTAITQITERDGLTYIRYTVECYNVDPVEKNDFEEPIEDVPLLPSIETQMNAAPVKEKKPFFESLFGPQGFAERSVAEIQVKDETVQIPAEFNDLAALFPSNVTVVSGSETAQASPIGIFHEVASAPVGTQIVIPGEWASQTFEATSQVMQDAMVVKRLDSGVSISFVEGVLHNPSSPPLIRGGNLILPPDKAEAGGFLTSSEKNGSVVASTTQPDTQLNIESKKLVPAVDGLPMAIHRVDTLFTNSTKLAIDQNVLHNPSSPPLIRGGNPALLSTPDSSPPSPSSEKIMARVSEDALVQPTATMQTPGVCAVETNSTDHVLPKITADSPIVFDQAPYHMEKTEHLIDSPAVVSNTHESITMRVQEEPSIGVQYEPVFQSQLEHHTVVDSVIEEPAAAVENVHEVILPTEVPVIPEQPTIVSATERVTASSPVAPENRPVEAAVNTPELAMRTAVPTETESRPVVIEPSPVIKTEKVAAAPIEIKIGNRTTVTTATEVVAAAVTREPAYLFAPLITSTPSKPRHIIRIEATNDELQQNSPAPLVTRPEFISEIRRRGSSPGSRDNRATQIVAPPPARATTQASI